jgi:glycosyltransferase involved in cell wall biosynthesis
MPKMGYLGTVLPKYLARLGLDVHILATDLPAYHNLDEYRTGMPTFLEQQVLSAGTAYTVDGYTVHVLGHKRVLGYVWMTGMYRKLKDIQPDVVYSILAIGWIPLQAALAKHLCKFQLFTGSHTTALMFPLANAASSNMIQRLGVLLTRWIPGRLISLFSQACYCPTHDCGEVAMRFFGVQRRKVKIVHLGVDSDFFFSIRSAEDRERRIQLRNLLGFSEPDVVCIYTGKMADFKNPLLLAQAIRILRAEGRQFKGLFIGDGAQRAQVAEFADCVVLDYMPFSALGDYYRAADIAVWLTNETTSMLDAAACGIPIVVSDRIYQDHVSGNGFAYRMNDLKSLCDTLRRLDDEGMRRTLGIEGARKMHELFTWERSAEIRFRDFNKALGRDG